MSLATLVADYNVNCVPDVLFRQAYLKSLSYADVLKAIRNYGRTKQRNGKFRYSTHFYRNRWYTIEQTDKFGTTYQLSKLLESELSKAAIDKNVTIKSFEDIYAEVSKIYTSLKNSRGIKGARQMTIYDISLYIGEKLEHLPNNVYFHQGVIVGANILGLLSTKPKQTIQSLSQVFTIEPRLRLLKEAVHVENFLCIYKNQMTDEKLKGLL